MNMTEHTLILILVTVIIALNHEMVTVHGGSSNPDLINSLKGIQWPSSIVNRGKRSVNDSENSTIDNNVMTKTKKPKKTFIRKLGLDLVDVVPEDERKQLNKIDVKFDPDDEDCDDSKRTVRIENPSEALAMLYFKCDYNARCNSEPEGCIKEKNCEYIVGWNKVGDYVLFEMAAYSVMFATITLSKDDKLGGDSITECTREENDTVAGYTSWNYVDEDEGIVYTKRRRSCATMVDFKGGMLDQLTLFCTWKRPIVSTVKGVKFDLNKPYYLISTAGYESTPGILGSIGKNEVVDKTDKFVVLDAYVGKTPFQQWVAHLHALLMVVIWMFVVPIGTFISRYMKGSWVKMRILKKYTFWFGMHFISSLATATVTLFSIGFMLATNNHWYADLIVDRLFTWHSILGFIISLFILIQLGLAYTMMKYKGKWKKKIDFKIKMCHGVMGHVIQYTGYACVFFSRYVREGFHCDSTSQLFWFAACFVLFHIIMSYGVCYSDFVLGRSSSRIYRIFLVDHHQNIGGEATLELEQLPEEDEPGSLFRKPLFFAFVIVLASFNIYFMYLMWHPEAKDCLTMRALRPASTKSDQGKLFS